MKANRSSKGGPSKERQVELTGKLVQKKFGSGSKSEHDAVYLETDEGSYVLRRVGANAFSDPGLKKLLGKTVCATGMITNTLFLASTVKDIS
jgi:hypothetical protein